MNMNPLVSNYIHIYKQIKDKLRWKVGDKRILMTIASLYVMKSKPFHGEIFLQIADELKNQSTVLSSMRFHLRYTTAAMLDVHFDNGMEQIPTFYHIYNEFIQNKFRKGNFTYVSASVLLMKKPTYKDEPTTEIISKAKAIYDGMRREHPFLTSASDYPLATLLAFEEQEDIIEHIEYLYDRLSNYSFRKGNDLQFLSHILSLHRDVSIDLLVNRMTRIYDAFKRNRVRPKSTYYPIMGMLALLAEDEVNFDAIIQIYKQLNHESEFRWQKDMNLIVAVCFYVSQKLEQDGLVETSLYTTMEAVLQAQQAVMVATIAGATAASSSNSSSQ